MRVYANSFILINDSAASSLSTSVTTVWFLHWWRWHRGGFYQLWHLYCVPYWSLTFTRVAYFNSFDDGSDHAREAGCVSRYPRLTFAAKSAISWPLGPLIFRAHTGLRNANYMEVFLLNWEGGTLAAERSREQTTGELLDKRRVPSAVSLPFFLFILFSPRYLDLALFRSLPSESPQVTLESDRDSAHEADGEIK